jgi:hypothetical protein
MKKMSNLVRKIFAVFLLVRVKPDVDLPFPPPLRPRGQTGSLQL